MPDLLGDFSYTWPWYLAGLCAYLLGAIPFGVLLTRLAGGGDLRRIGSGNIGATNVLRTGRKGLALLTLFLDGGKGFAAVAGAGFYGPDFCVIAAVMVVVGHMFPLWLGFRGGKGVATGLGVLLGLAWPVALVAMLLWLLVAKLTRYSSLAALIAVPAAPLVLMLELTFQRNDVLPLWLPGLPQFVPALWLIAALVMIRHHANIRRLLTGREPKIGEPPATS